MPYFDQLAHSGNVANFASDLIQGLDIWGDSINQIPNVVGDYKNQLHQWGDGTVNDIAGIVGDYKQGLNTWGDGLNDNVNDIASAVGDYKQGFHQWGDEFTNNAHEFSSAVEDHKGHIFSGIDDILVEKGWDINSLPISKVGLVIIGGILWPVVFSFILWIIGGGSIIPVARMGTLAGRAVNEGVPMLTTLANKMWDHRADVIDLVSARSMDSLSMDSISSIINDIGNAMRRYES